MPGQPTISTIPISNPIKGHTKPLESQVYGEYKVASCQNDIKMISIIMGLIFNAI